MYGLIMDIIFIIYQKIKCKSSFEHNIDPINFKPTCNILVWHHQSFSNFVFNLP
jgi:hypothetical protein